MKKEDNIKDTDAQMVLDEVPQGLPENTDFQRYSKGIIISSFIKNRKSFIRFGSSKPENIDLSQDEILYLCFEQYDRSVMQGTKSRWQK